MDIIFIDHLQLDTVIGVYDWEKTVRQRVYVDLEMSVNTQAAADTDALSHTIDYRVLSDRLLDFAANNQCELIETLAEQIATIVMNEFKPLGLKLTLTKPDAVHEAKGVGLKIQRGDI